jgi:hypothetical protein
VADREARNGVVVGRERNVAVNGITPGTPIGGPPVHTYTGARRQIMVKPEVLAPAFRLLSEIDASCSTGNRLNAHQMAQTLSVGTPDVNAAW